MKFTIRKAKSKDAQASLELRFQLIEAYPDSFRTTLEEVKKKTIKSQEELIEKSASQKNSLMLLAEIENRLVGMVNCFGEDRFKIRHVGTIGGLGVLPQFCGQDIGAALMKKLIRWAKEKSSIERLQLSVYSDSKRAVKLYRDLGFNEEGVFKKASKKDDGSYQNLINMVMFFSKKKS